ncbi:hypothetical protein OG21DRAFT_1507015 [Imleria badia]|nr:hypothetical protein OG21DRAFT_1507015 [Imleria badia]
MTVHNIQCDRSRPHCTQCARRSTPCIYGSDPKGKRNASQPTLAPARVERYSAISSRSAVRSEHTTGLTRGSTWNTRSWAVESPQGDTNHA